MPDCLLHEPIPSQQRPPSVGRELRQAHTLLQITRQYTFPKWYLIRLGD
uniref:Uncharacterized protein n=1 Tax=Anguilla anguilla TaxID=7936 RepID=A0A0E9W0V3_ANGAN